MKTNAVAAKCCSGHRPRKKVLPAAELERRKALIEKLDLRRFVWKIGSDHPDMKREEILQAVADYRMFLTLILLHPKKLIRPSRAIDLVWHAHILDTVRYQADCERIFGYFLHHAPEFPRAGKARGHRRAPGARAMVRLFKQTFGTSPNYASGAKCCSRCNRIRSKQQARCGSPKCCGHVKQAAECGGGGKCAAHVRVAKAA